MSSDSGTEGTKMRKRVFGISLSIAFVAAGCASTQLHQSLLVHENQRLEDALYTAHAQVADLKRENESLRKHQTDESLGLPGWSRTGFWDDDFDVDSPLEMPRVILPGESGTAEIPESLSDSQMIHIWTPVR